MSDIFGPRREPVESPYPMPLDEGVAARVVMARSAHTFLPDIEAMLTEYEMPTELAPTVADLVDVSDFYPTIRSAVEALQLLMRTH